MGTTFEALSRHPEQPARDDRARAARRSTRRIDSFPVQRPFLRDSADLAEELEPVADEIERSLPLVADAFEVGAPVQAQGADALPRTPRRCSARSTTWPTNPNTLLALKRPAAHARGGHAARGVRGALPDASATTGTTTGPAIGEHVSEVVPGGTGQRSISKSGNNTQDNRVSSTDADRPVDVPASEDPQTAEVPGRAPMQALHNGAYGAAIDAQGNADCEVGQRGYVDRPERPNGALPALERQGRGRRQPRGALVPGGRSGPTYKARELGIDNLKDVP